MRLTCSMAWAMPECFKDGARGFWADFNTSRDPNLDVRGSSGVGEISDAGTSGEVAAGTSDDVSVGSVSVGCTSSLAGDAGTVTRGPRPPRECRRPPRRERRAGGRGDCAVAGASLELFDSSSDAMSPSCPPTFDLQWNYEEPTGLCV